MLSTIIEHKLREVKEAKAKQPNFENLKKSEISFKAALKGKSQISIISEIKKASPSRGVIDPEFNYKQIAKNYQEAGASCISVLTDSKFFQGSLQVMKDITEIVSLPVLRKDFVVDLYQISEARNYGANAVLLIAKVIDDLAPYQQLAQELGMDVLVEVHSAEELERALKLAEENLIIGINNRNLDNLEMDMNTVPSLIKRIPENYTVVAESGYKTSADLESLKGKVDAALIGTSIMQSADRIKTIKEFTGILA